MRLAGIEPTSGPLSGAGATVLVAMTLSKLSRAGRRARERDFYDD
jgi:hypothetical protein